MKKSKKENLDKFPQVQIQKPQQKKKKVDPLKTRGINYIDYKDTRLLQRFVNEQGKILPGRITGISSKMQRQLTKAIKRARHLALMPFVSEDFKP
ncbi:MAG: 30S ribosomal protein S18 [Ignavibacteria bacterium]|nr:30S ribosomal protein S18 [Ignavibacteria bacterium]